MGLDLDNYDFENPIGFNGEYSKFGGLVSFKDMFKDMKKNHQEIRDKTSDLIENNTETSKQTTPDALVTQEKFLGMPRKVGIGVTIGVSVLAIAGIVFAIVKKKK